MTQQPTLLSPSILSANFARLGEHVTEVVKAGAQWIHVDIMDQHFVPNLTFGPIVCQALRQYGITVPLDVHLMITPVIPMVPAFAKAGASLISFHPEATESVSDTIDLIQSHDVQVGVAINPDTSLELCKPFLDRIDVVLLMSVNPGFAGQSFMPHVLDKIVEARELIDQSGHDIRLEVDGGIGLSNVAKVVDAGADTIVMGSAIFNTPSPAQTVSKVFSILSE